MLNQVTLDKLAALKLTGMAAAYEKQLEQPEVRGLSFEERFGMLVDSHWTWRENQALARRLKKSKLSAEPCVEDINYRYPRQMDAATMRALTNSQWVAQHLSVLFRANRHRQIVAGAGAGAKGLPRWLQRPVPIRSQTVPRSGGGTGRWQSGPIAGLDRPHRCAAGG